MKNFIELNEKCKASKVKLFVQQEYKRDFNVFNKLRK